MAVADVKGRPAQRDPELAARRRRRGPRRSSKRRRARAGPPGAGRGRSSSSPTHASLGWLLLRILGRDPPRPDGPISSRHPPVRSSGACRPSWLAPGRGGSSPERTDGSSTCVVKGQAAARGRHVSPTRELAGCGNTSAMRGGSGAIGSRGSPPTIVAITRIGRAIRIAGAATTAASNMGIAIAMRIARPAIQTAMCRAADPAVAVARPRP